MKTIDTTHRPDTSIPDGVIAIAVMSLGLHMADHALPAPCAIDVRFDADGRPSLRVRVGGVADQLRWINTVEVDDQDEEPTDFGARIVWHVRLPFGTRVDLVGLRDAATTGVSA